MGDNGYKKHFLIMISFSIMFHSVFGMSLAKTAFGKEIDRVIPNRDIQILEIQGVTQKTVLRVAQKLALTAQFEPGDAVNKNITWSSSDSTIASVDENGIVLARKQGQVAITVTTEGGLEASSVITVNPLLDPSDINRPQIAGYGYVHPLSLASMKMVINVESEIKDAKLIIAIPDIGLLFSPTGGVIIKVNDNKLDGSYYSVANDTININLGDLNGYDKNPTIYNITVHVKMNPTSNLGNINDYNTRVAVDKEKLIISNKLEASIKIGGVFQRIEFKLEPYELELIKIPRIN